MLVDLFKGTILDFEVTNVTLMFSYFVTALIQTTAAEAEFEASEKPCR